MCQSWDQRPNTGLSDLIAERQRKGQSPRIYLEAEVEIEWAGLKGVEKGLRVVRRAWDRRIRG